MSEASPDFKALARYWRPPDAFTDTAQIDPEALRALCDAVLAQAAPSPDKEMVEAVALAHQLLKCTRLPPAVYGHADADVAQICRALIRSCSAAAPKLPS
jgi:hypothetical protein